MPSRTDGCILASAGMQAERHTLHKVLKAKATMFENTHRKQMSAHSMAQCLSNTLYYKRFFPYYTFNVLAGLDEKGAGSVWGYDAIGSYERVPYVVNGSGSALATSILDNQVLPIGHLQQVQAWTLCKSGFVQDTTSKQARSYFGRDSEFGEGCLHLYF